MNDTMLALPAEERPRERFLLQGEEQMSSAELLAILLGSGIRGIPVLHLAQHLLCHFGNLQAIAEASIHELLEIKGLGKAKAIQLKAALALGQRAAQKPRTKKQTVSSPSEAYQIVRHFLEKQKQEHFLALLLNAKGDLIQQITVGIGTLSAALVHPREVFYPAIHHRAASMILAHNHPSGDPTPSKEDLAATEELISVGKLVQIPLQDHIIVGNGGFISLRSQGISF